MNKKERYNTILNQLADYIPPCEIDNTMSKYKDYCIAHCGADKKATKECWNIYITEQLREILMTKEECKNLLTMLKTTIRMTEDVSKEAKDEAIKEVSKVLTKKINGGNNKC